MIKHIISKSKTKRKMKDGSLKYTQQVVYKEQVGVKIKKVLNKDSNKIEETRIPILTSITKHELID